MLLLYNTLTRKKEIFRPYQKDRIGMYVCGPTIYGPSHLGHARTYVAFDVIRRYLELKGYRVKFVMNITDIHDDMIKRAQQEKTTINQLVRKYLPLFHQDMESLKVKKPTVEPRVTQHIPEIIKMIKKLIKNGLAYVNKGSVYFDVSQFKDYGQLSGIKLKKTKTGTRVETDKYKEEAIDFVLWKKAKPNEPSWSSPWGRGRPGWHIECSAMSQKYLGPRFDIHGGAKDLIFPHHENEIAQSEGATGQKPFVKYWLHSGLLKVNGQKMSKSLGNYIELPEAIKKFHPLVLRYFFLKTHYRSPIDFTEKALQEASQSLERIWNFMEKIQEIKKTKKKTSSRQVKTQIKKIISQSKKEFQKQMDDDFNTPKALAAVFKLIKKINPYLTKGKLSSSEAKTIDDFLKEINQVFQILKPPLKVKKIPQIVKKLIQEREKARKNKDWSKADYLRELIKQKGYLVLDTPQGPQLKPLKR